MCRFSSQSELRRVAAGPDHEIPVPGGETILDGEWLLAILEVGRSKRATAVAARAVMHEDRSAFLLFEPRDWEQVVLLAAASGTEPPPSERDPSIERSPASSRRATTRPPVERARVLLVDDDEGILHVVGTMLEAVGLDVTPVVDGEQALRRLAKAAFDMVLLDWTLPGISGLDLCREIRGGRSSKIPILLLTANAAPSDLVLAFASGADDYLVKPFRAPELGARILGLLRRSRVVADAAR